MGRIRITDLPRDLSIGEKEMRALRGGSHYVLSRRDGLQYYYATMLTVKDFREEQSYYPSQ